MHTQGNKMPAAASDNACGKRPAAAASDDACGKRTDTAAAVTAVKICGLVSAEDALAVNAAGADYAGFVFHPASKRNLTYEKAREIMEALDPGIRRVAVVVSPSTEKVREIQALPFDLIQIHGSCPAQTLEQIRIPVWRAVNIAGLDEWTVSASEEGMDRISGILVDAKEYGSGKTFDWNAAEQISAAVRRLCAALAEKSGKKVKFILAGGLHVGNVAEGIRLFAPDVADVSSGVEYGDAPGKDPEKIKAFTEEVRLIQIRNG